ncbi:Uncharacterized protein ABJ98_4591 [Pseudomonas syringae pv. aceris]|nr:Uncharacterized protein ABJ98_4591 [Pseudomonas syringae pv. aceris]
MRGLDSVTHGLFAQVHPQRQGIDEHAEGSFGALAALHPAHQYGAEHYVFTSAEATQHLRERQMDQARRADPKLPRLNSQALAQTAVQHQTGLIDSVTVALYIVQVERQRRLVDVAKHVLEEQLVVAFVQAQSGLSDIVAVRNGVAKLIGLTEQADLHLIAHLIQRGVVKDHVVKHQGRQPALVDGVQRTHQTHQGGLTDVQAYLAWVQTLLQLTGYITKARVELHFFYAELDMAPDHLQRLVEAFPVHGGAQDVMAVDDRLQRLSKGIQVSAAVKGELRLQYIGVALFGADVVIENARLQGGQRVDVLYVRRAARHASDHLIDLHLGQVDQRQHVRGDFLAVGWNAVGRDHQLVDRACRRSQCREGRLAEQCAHVGTQAGLAHTFNQAHRQQRMAAQFKEVVVATDTLDVEQVAPDLRQSDFGCALWRLVAATDQCITVRCGQGLAVEFAVRGQRHCIEQHIGRRDHVGRQSFLQPAAQAVDVH